MLLFREQADNTETDSS